MTARQRAMAARQRVKGLGPLYVDKVQIRDLKNISKSTSKFDGKVNFDKFIDDGFFDNDLIELIYDNNQPKQIQRIWGKDNDKINLSASNKDFLLVCSNISLS